MAREVKKTKKAEEEPPKNGPLVEHPDLFHTIVQYVDTDDLIKLSKTCATFRSILMKERSSYIWKVARGNLKPEGFPGCPEDMSELAYALFVFGTQCHGCNLQRKTQEFCSAVSLRLCKQCWNGRLLVRIESTDPLLKAVMYRITSVMASKKQRHPRAKFYVTQSYLDITLRARRDQLEEAQEKMAAIQDEYEGEAREREEKVCMSRMEAACSAKKEHAKLLSCWLTKRKAAEGFQVEHA